MRLSTSFATVIGFTSTAAAILEERASGVQGFDISSYQPSVDFEGAYSSGARFVIIKVSPATGYYFRSTDPKLRNHL